jgi:hypothetical protein
MVTSIGEVVERIAKSVYSLLHQKESLIEKGARFLKIFKTFRPVMRPSEDGSFKISIEPVSRDFSGIAQLEKIMDELGRFIETEVSSVHIVFDEFQEITELKNPSVEGVLRSHIQEHQASYFFVGSRRRLLLDIFNQRSRPFYQSAIMYPLIPLPREELTTFLLDQFQTNGKNCPRHVAERISERVSQYPYYAQLLAYNMFEISKKTVTEQDLEKGFEKLLASERYGYEGIIQTLTGPQISLLRALAADPAPQIHSTEYMTRHKLTVGGIQYAKKKLLELDLIEKQVDAWRVVDPVFGAWLKSY